jgi:ankyrin repeat protein
MDRCEEARKYQRIDDAFRDGDLEALRAAVDEPYAIPNGLMPDTIGPCLVYAIYRSPLAFIRTLLEIGADPNAPVDDGFPPLIAALCCARERPGTIARTDVAEVIKLLLAFGTDPNQRGINDYTPLHMAVEERNPAAVRLLLDGGADPHLRTRIDSYETPLEMAESPREGASPELTQIVAMLRQAMTSR